MEIGTLLAITGQIITAAQNIGIIRTDGKIVFTPDNEFVFAARVEAILKANGVDIPAKVDAILQMLPNIVTAVS